MIRKAIIAAAHKLEASGVQLSLGLNSPLIAATVKPDGVVVAPEAVEVLSKTMGNNIRLIKNLLLPDVKELILAISKDATERELEIKHIIPEYDYHNQPESLSLLIDRGYLNMDIVPERKEIFPITFEMTYDELENKLGVGSGALHLESRKRLLKDNRYEYIYDEYVMNIGNTPAWNHLLTITTSQSMLEELVDVLLVLLSIKANGYTGTVSAIKGYGISMEHAIGNVRFALYHSLQSYKQLSSRNVLYTKFENVITMFKDNVDLYLKDGGDIEAIFGASLSYDIGKLALIKENQEGLKTKWNTHRSSLELYGKVQNIDMYKAVYLKHIGDVYNKPSEELKPYVFKPEEKMKEAIDYINNTGGVELFDVDKVVRDVYLGILYGHTNAGRFAEIMKSYLDSDETVSENQAAVLASFELLTDYILKDVVSN